MRRWLNSSGDYRGSVKFLGDHGLPDEALEDMLDSPGGPGHRLDAGRGGRERTSVAHALVETILDAEFAPAPSSTHELVPDDIAELVEPFLLRS